jgi:hypothetical protein
VTFPLFAMATLHHVYMLVYCWHLACLYTRKLQPSNLMLISLQSCRTLWSSRCFITQNQVHVNYPEGCFVNFTWEQNKTCHLFGGFFWWLDSSGQFAASGSALIPTNFMCWVGCDPYNSSIFGTLGSQGLCHMITTLKFHRKRWTSWSSCCEYQLRSETSVTVNL